MEPALQPSAYEEPCVYERFPGAATTPLAPAYRPRQPHASVLHRVVRENLLTFLEQGTLHCTVRAVRAIHSTSKTSCAATSLAPRRRWASPASSARRVATSACCPSRARTAVSVRRARAGA